MKLSIVTTLYRSSADLFEFYTRATAVANQFAKDDYELILVNDGSPDNSLDIAIQLAKSDDHIIIIDLSRNFGHHKAMMTGLAHAMGDFIFLIDSDLEESPEWLLNFSAELFKTNCDVIYGVQEERKGGVFERLSGRWFYRLFKLLSGVTLPENVITARLMTRRYVNALIMHQEREVVIAGLWVITGFEQKAQSVSKRNVSKTTYTLRKKISVLVNAITSFSNTPLIAIFHIGSAILFLSATYILYLLINWALFSKPADGWTSVMASIWFLGGLISSFIGVIGIYLSKIFSETKNRPYTIVREIHNNRITKIHRDTPL
ncbi:glycosyltransferase family 2 protein [Pollutimonas sp. H1-120]|uniref:glycosyltransferase family 2 protein n=1 Tax=Pollutimonas sp. H1-120 TaxID=3148824 RepID=UPI003B52D488